MSAPATARAHARAQVTSDIKAAARRQVAEAGASSLSLRAVARELGMASSALYRYFPSRDHLLTALIVDAYDAVGAAAEDAVDRGRGGFLARWTAVAVAIREWAVAHPHDYALVYGSPVPGYAAPPDTISPAVRVSLAALRVVADGVAGGEVGAAPSGPLPRSVRADLARLRTAAAPGVADEVLARFLVAWTSLFGTISFELFGHSHGVVEDDDAFFRHQARQVGRLIAEGRA